MPVWPKPLDWKESAEMEGGDTLAAESSTQNRLLSELHSSDLPWQTSCRHEAPEKSLRWIPLAALETSSIQLGLSFDGWWVVPGPHTATEFRPGVRCVFLLPVLEVPLDEVRRVLAKGLQQKGLPEDLLAAFPFEDVVATGLESSSDYWVRLALTWAEQLPASEQLRDTLQTVATEGPTQKSRHAARTLLARKRRESSTVVRS
jgi:hypothetical protein